MNYFKYLTIELFQIFNAGCIGNLPSIIKRVKELKENTIPKNIVN